VYDCSTGYPIGVTVDTPANELPGLFELVSDEAYLYRPLAGSRVTHRCECPLSPQLVIRSTSCLIPGYEFSGSADRMEILLARPNDIGENNMR